MQFRVSGKNIDVGEALRERVTARIAEMLGKYFDGGYSGHATVGKEAFGYHTECMVHLDSGIVLRSDAMAADANKPMKTASRCGKQRCLKCRAPGSGGLDRRLGINEDDAEIIDVRLGRTAQNKIMNGPEKSGRVVVLQEMGGIEV